MLCFSSCKINLFKVARNKELRYQVWDVQCLKDGQKIFVKNLDGKGAVTICKETASVFSIMVEGNRAMQMEKLLKERQIEYNVIATDAVMGPFTKTTPVRVKSPSFNYKAHPANICIDWKDYYPLQKVYNFMEALESEFPSRCSVIVIGKTTEGRDIKLLKISNSNASNTGVWIDGTIHAREWISTSVVTYICNYIVRNFEQLPQHITGKDWFIVPVLNPDGYVHSHNVDRFWRKNRAVVQNNPVGVDLNRNFSYFGDENELNEGTLLDPNSTNFRGPAPFSEPETAALKDFILYSGTPFKVFLTFHSYSEVIAFPWCHVREPCPDYVNLLEGGTAMSKAIFDTSGRMYKVGAFQDLMYTARGTSIDWSYGIAHIPFSYLVELRSKIHKFVMPKDEILVCCKESMSAIVALSEYVHKHKSKNCTMYAEKAALSKRPSSSKRR